MQDDCKRSSNWQHLQQCPQGTSPLCPASGASPVCEKNIWVGKLMEKRGSLGYPLWTTSGTPEDLDHCFQLRQSPKTSPTRQPKHPPAPDLPHALPLCHAIAQSARRWSPWGGLLPVTLIRKDHMLCHSQSQDQSPPCWCQAERHRYDPALMPHSQARAPLGSTGFALALRLGTLLPCSWPNAMGNLRGTCLVPSFSALGKVLVRSIPFPLFKHKRTQKPRKEPISGQPVLSAFEQYLFQAWSRYKSSKKEVVQQGDDGTHCQWAQVCQCPWGVRRLFLCHTLQRSR